MKKIVCFSLVLLALVGCLTSCNLTKSMLDSYGDKSEGVAKAEELISALSEGRSDDAKTFMHTDVSEKSDDAIDQLCKYLDGRKAESVELISFKVNTSVGTSGTTRQEQLSFHVKLDDGDSFFVSALYLSDTDGTGFTSFQVVLGVI